MLTRRIFLLFLIVFQWGKDVHAINPPTIAGPKGGITIPYLQGFLEVAPVTGATGYIFEYDTTINFNSNKVKKDTSSSVYFETGLLHKGKTYYWRAKSYKPGDTSVWSTTASFVSTQVLNLVSPTNNTTGPVTYLNVSYLARQNIVNFNYEIDTSISFNSINRIKVTTNINFLLDTNFFKFGRTIYWKAFASTSLGDTIYAPGIRSYTIHNQPDINTEVSFRDPAFNIGWPTAGVSNIELEIDTNAGFSSPNLVSKMLPSGTVRDSLKDLYFGKKYNYRIRAKFGSNLSNWSLVRSFTVYNNVLNVTPNSGSGQVPLLPLFSWNGMAGVTTQFQLFKDSLYQNLLKDTMLKVNSYRVWQALDLSKKYFYRVRHMHAKDTQQWTVNSFTTTSGALNLFSPADNLIKAEVRQQFVFVPQSWATGYILQIDTGTQFGTALSSQGIQITSFKLNNLNYPFADTVLRYGQNYVWRVYAIKGLDTGAASVPRKLTSMQRPESYFPPNNFIGTGSAVNGLVTGIKGSSHIQWELDTSVSFSSALYQTRTDLHIPDDFDPKYVLLEFPGELFFETKYYWRSRCINSVDTSDWSSTFNFVTTTEVRIIRPLDKSVNVKLIPVLEWNIQGSVVDYRFQYQLRTDSLFDQTGIITTTAGESSIDSFTANYATTYYWRARALHAKDTSLWSKIVSFTTLAIPTLASPALVSPANGAINIPLGSVDLRWSPVANATSYEAQASTDETFGLVIAAGVTSTTSIFFTGVQPKTLYYWRVRAKVTGFDGPWSFVRSFQTTVPIGVNELREQIQLSVFPNPAHSMLNIHADVPVKLTVYDMKGERIYTSDRIEKIQSINTQQWSAGLYQLVIQSGQSQWSERVMIEH